MLKTWKSIESSPRPREGGVGVDGDSRVRHDGNELDESKVDSGEVVDDEIRKKVQKMFKSKNLSKSKKTVGSDFLTLGVKLAFTKLRQLFVKTLILYHFDPKRHI